MSNTQFDDALYSAELCANAAIELPALLVQILEERGLVSSADLRQALIAAVEMHRARGGNPAVTFLLENTARHIIENIGRPSHHLAGHA